MNMCSADEQDNKREIICNVTNLGDLVLPELLAHWTVVFVKSEPVPD